MVLLESLEYIFVEKLEISSSVGEGVMGFWGWGVDWEGVLEASLVTEEEWGVLVDEFSEEVLSAS